MKDLLPMPLLASSAAVGLASVTLTSGEYGAVLVLAAGLAVLGFAGAVRGWRGAGPGLPRLALVLAAVLALAVLTDVGLRRWGS